MYFNITEDQYNTIKWALLKAEDQLYDALRDPWVDQAQIERSLPRWHQVHQAIADLSFQAAHSYNQQEAEVPF
jgi:hypothetical protein